jgi:hypothetical protein
VSFSGPQLSILLELSQQFGTLALAAHAQQEAFACIKSDLRHCHLHSGVDPGNVRHVRAAEAGSP